VVRPDATRPSSSLKVAAAYLLLCGTASLLITLFVPPRSDFSNLTTAVKAGGYARQLLFCLCFLVGGVGIFLGKRWARTLSLVVLVVEIPNSAAHFAWGFAGGKPGLSVHIGALITLVVWNGMWFYIVLQGGVRGGRNGRADDTGDSQGRYVSADAERCNEDQE
jgi:hypothetical protein